MTPISRISSRSTGHFDPKNWFSEGDGLLASATKIRDTWKDHRQTFSQTIRNPQRADPSDWHLLTGLPRASMLLLAHSVEMYLKAGMAKAYCGCSERMFNRDVKNRLSHKLTFMAKELLFDLKVNDEQNLAHLKDMILFDARYPAFVPDGASYSDTVNQQTQRIWSDNNFNAFSELAKRVRQHSHDIDSNSANPASFTSVTIDYDGYLTLRIGGNLMPRITYCVSSTQKSNSETSMDDMKALFASHKYQHINHFWDHAWIFEDGENRTYFHTRP